jgi:hypothetical protein
MKRKKGGSAIFWDSASLLWGGIAVRIFCNVCNFPQFFHNYIYVINFSQIWIKKKGVSKAHIMNFKQYIVILNPSKNCVSNIPLV